MALAGQDLGRSFRSKDGGDFFRDHHAWLCRWISAIESNHSVCDDIASQTFMELLRIERYTHIDHPRALLKTIARRLLCDRRRRLQVERRYLADLAWRPEPLGASSEDELIVREGLSRVGQVLATLSPNARSAFLYSQIDGLTYAEIGRRLGVSTSRVQQYMVSAFRVCAEVAEQ